MLTMACASGRAGAWFLQSIERLTVTAQTNRRKRGKWDPWILSLTETRGKSRRAHPSPRGVHPPTESARAWRRAPDFDRWLFGDANTLPQAVRRPSWHSNQSEHGASG